jgi:hypothetical protein
MKAQKIKNFFGKIQHRMDLFSDFLSNIPVIGIALDVIIHLIFLIPIIFIFIVGFVLILEFLYTIHPLLALLAFLVLLNILSYCASFVWQRKKPWFFGASLFLSIAFFVLAIKGL